MPDHNTLLGQLRLLKLLGSSPRVDSSDLGRSLISTAMLTLFMSISQNLEELFSDGDGFSFMTDLSLSLSYAFVSVCQEDLRRRLGFFTAGTVGSFGSRVNIFFTQNLKNKLSAKRAV